MPSSDLLNFLGPAVKFSSEEIKKAKKESKEMSKPTISLYCLKVSPPFIYWVRDNLSQALYLWIRAFSPGFCSK